MTQIMKQKLVMIFVSLALACAFFAFIIMNRSLAWFADNDRGDANGMSVSANVSPNLIIAKSADALLSENLSFKVDFEESAVSNMVAVTRDPDIEGTYLKFLKSPYAIDNRTGLAKGDAVLEFDPVPTTDNAQYFIDYTVYIASAYGELHVSSLEASIVIPDHVELAHFNAASVDIYVESVDADGYRGTTSVAGAPQATVDLFGGNGGEVPLNTEGSITVIMRCYFDGALVDPDSGNAYINSYSVTSEGVVLGIAFTAIE